MRYKQLTAVIVKYIILFSSVVIILLPIWLLVVSSFRETGSFLSYPPKLWPEDFTLKNYISLFDPVRFQYIRWFINSFIFGFGSTAIVVIICTMAGYAFAKKQFFGKTILFSIILVTLMVPQIVSLIPTFLIADKLGLINTYSGLIFPTVPSAFGVFLMRQFIQVLPSALEESAYLDGCGEYKAFFKIIFPLSLPFMSVLAIFHFVSIWSNLAWPLVVVTDMNMRTLTLGIAAMKHLGSNVSGEIMAASFLSFIPMFIVFMFAREKFIEGMTAGAVKG